MDPNTPVLIGGVIGFLSSILTEPVKEWFFGPKLKIEFNPKKLGHATRPPAGPEGEYQESHIRVLVTNKRKRIAKQCRAYLVNFEVWNTSLARFRSTEYCEAIQLAWSASGERAFDPVDIPKDVYTFVNVVSLHKARGILVHMLADLEPYRSLLSYATGKLRYTVLVAGDNLKPQSIKVVVVWNRNWADYEVYPG